MNKFGKKLLAAGLCLGLALGTVTGCGAGNTQNAGKAIAVLDGENIDYALVNFMTKYNQAQMQSMYGAMAGNSLWDGYGETMKTSIVESLQQMLILEKHAAEYGVALTDAEKAYITETAATFLAENDEKVLKAMTATQEVVERMLTLSLIQNKMQAEIIKDVDTEVSDEEAAQKTVRYVLLSTADTTDEEGNAVAMTDEEKAAKKENAQKILDAVKEGTDLEEAAKAVDEGLTASSTSYGAENGSINETLKAAVDSLEDGQCVDAVVEAENGYYVAEMVTTFDETATQTQKESIVSQRQSDKFTEVYEIWKEEAEFTTDEELLKDINFADIFTVKAEETEAAE